MLFLLRNSPYEAARVSLTTLFSTTKEDEAVDGEGVKEDQIVLRRNEMLPLDDESLVEKQQKDISL